MTPEHLLSTLVAFPTVVGRPNGALIDFVRDYLAEHGVSSTVIVGPEGDRFNLFATIGPSEVPGLILSGHVDVVPAEEAGWQGDPFRLRCEGERLIGRGAVDMKGFVAAVLASVPMLVRAELKRPIHLALSYDEEAGCRGVPHLINKLSSLCPDPWGCIVGEPTGLAPVLRHKGKAAVKVIARGVPGHSSRPDQGLNAIHALVPVLAAATGEAERLRREGPFDASFAPEYSSLQVGLMSGGAALNIIPAQAEAAIEARSIAGVDPMQVLGPVLAAASADGALSHEVLSQYPALALGPTAPLARLVAEVSGREPVAAVSFGTEAGLFQAAGIPAVVCGPGDIARAHRPEEYILRDELAGVVAMMGRLAERLAA